MGLNMNNARQIHVSKVSRLEDASLSLSTYRDGKEQAIVTKLLI